MIIRDEWLVTVVGLHHEGDQPGLAVGVGSLAMQEHEPGYVLDPNWEHERRRLALLEQVWDGLSTARLAALGVAPGARCLEIGGGGGSIARWLCQEVGEAGHVTAVDLEAMRAWVESLRKTGTDYEWGRCLPTHLQRQGLEAIGGETDVVVLRGGSPVAEFWSLSLELLRPRITDMQLATGEEIDAARTLLGDPEFWDLSPAFVAAWGRSAAS